MLSVQKRAYPHEVTLYHLNEDKTITRTAANGFMDYRKNKNVDKTGSTQVNSFLLLLPPEYQVSVGDKVYFGNGPKEIDWAQFIPIKVPGLVVVRYIDPKYWGEKLHHTEVGG